ncbi:MAG: class I SAM-dependent methyltransferase [Alphaproteobacteria bacterium]
MRDLTPLATQLTERIQAVGPISIADYMATCLSDPAHGYYTNRDPLGRSGDFVTAPEISQIFGELIGIWCLSVWQGMGSPSRFVLAELGPGRGTLLADALRAARLRPAFGNAAEVALVEINEDLKVAQQATLHGLANPIWIDRPESIPDGPTIVIANEFFDALPIRQFVRTDSCWAERMVGLGPSGELVFGLRPTDGAPLIAGAPTTETENNFPVGAVVETRPTAESIVRQLADRVARMGGAALIIDYGHSAPAFGDTLQAVRRHQYDDPLAHPGLADITAHVDFDALARAAIEGGASARRTVDHASFLENMGITIRAELLSNGQPPSGRAEIAAAVERLTGPDQMGSLFKVLGFGSQQMSLPGFDSVD